MADTLYDRFASTPEGRKLLNREDLTLKVTELVCKCMKEQKITRTKLAQMLGKTKGRVSQMLNGERNLTLHTVADIFTVLGVTVDVNRHRETLSMQPGTPRSVYKWVLTPPHEPAWQCENDTATVESFDVAG